MYCYRYLLYLIVSSHTSWQEQSYPIPQGPPHIIALRAQSTLIFQRKRNPGITLYNVATRLLSSQCFSSHQQYPQNRRSQQDSTGPPTLSTYLSSLLPISFTLSLHSTHSPHQSHLAYPPYFFGTFNNNSHWIYILKETYEIIIYSYVSPMQKSHIQCLHLLNIY